MSRIDDLRVLRLRIEREIAEEQRKERARGRRGKRRTPAEHGTDTGYQYHARKGIPFPEDSGGEPCGCREAHTAYERDRARRVDARQRARLAAGDLTAETPYREAG